MVSAPHINGSWDQPWSQPRLVSVRALTKGVHWGWDKLLWLSRALSASGIAAGRSSTVPNSLGKHKQNSMLGTLLPRASDAAPWLIFTWVRSVTPTVYLCLPRAGHKRHHLTGFLYPSLLSQPPVKTASPPPLLPWFSYVYSSPLHCPCAGSIIINSISRKLSGYCFLPLFCIILYCFYSSYLPFHSYSK